LTSIVAVY